jgi:hypothetical protein
VVQNTGLKHATNTYFDWLQVNQTSTPDDHDTPNEDILNESGSGTPCNCPAGEVCVPYFECHLPDEKVVFR